MWVWLVVGYAALVFVLIGCAGFVALFVSDEKRRTMAYDVLKLLLKVATGGTGVVTVVLKFHQAGLW